MVPSRTRGSLCILKILILKKHSTLSLPRLCNQFLCACDPCSSIVRTRVSAADSFASKVFAEPNLSNYSRAGPTVVDVETKISTWADFIFIYDSLIDHTALIRQLGFGFQEGFIIYSCVDQLVLICSLLDITLRYYIIVGQSCFSESLFVALLLWVF